MLMDWLPAILNNALLGVIVGFIGAYLLQRRIEKTQQAELLQIRHSMRSVLRDEIDHSKELLRQYQDYLEASVLGTFDIENVQYLRLLNRPLDVWHAMWES